jgi:hypothetical protein
MRTRYKYLAAAIPFLTIFRLGSAVDGDSKGKDGSECFDGDIASRDAVGCLSMWLSKLA